ENGRGRRVLAADLDTQVVHVGDVDVDVDVLRLPDGEPEGTPVLLVQEQRDLNKRLVRRRVESVQRRVETDVPLRQRIGHVPDAIGGRIGGARDDQRTAVTALQPVRQYLRDIAGTQLGRQITEEHVVSGLRRRGCPGTRRLGVSAVSAVRVTGSLQDEYLNER